MYNRKRNVQSRSSFVLPCQLGQNKTNFAKLSNGDIPGHMEIFSTKYRPICQSKGNSK